MDRETENLLANVLLEIEYVKCPKEAARVAATVMKASESENPETREKSKALIQRLARREEKPP